MKYQTLIPAALAVGALIASAALLGAVACSESPGPAPTTPAPAPPPPSEPQPQRPAVPDGLRIYASGDDFIEWSWNAVQGADGYDVHFSANETFSEGEIIARTAEQTSYRREGLAAGTSGWLRVRAASGSGEDRITSDWSSHVTGMTTPPPPPPPPATLPEPRVCSDERERTLEVGPTVRNWDGEPIVFEVLDNFPDHTMPDWVTRQLAVVSELADRIEEQVGYRIVEAGTIIPPPDGLADGWDSVYSSAYDACENGPLYEEGRIVGFNIRETPEWHYGRGASEAWQRCAGVLYFMSDGIGEGPWFETAVVHELFHVLGFKHPYEEEADWPGIAMSAHLLDGDSGGDDLGYMRATFEDIDALRCIYPDPRGP